MNYFRCVSCAITLFWPILWITRNAEQCVRVCGFNHTYILHTTHNSVDRRDRITSSFSQVVTSILFTPHNDVIKWKHFPRYWPFARGPHRSPVNFPHKGQWRGALMFSLICVRLTVEYKIVRLVIWDAIVPIMTSLQWAEQMTESCYNALQKGGLEYDSSSTKQTLLQTVMYRRGKSQEFWNFPI